MRLIFMGTPAFSVPVLEALVAAGHDVAAARRARQKGSSDTGACARAGDGA